MPPVFMRTRRIAPLFWGVHLVKLSQHKVALRILVECLDAKRAPERDHRVFDLDVAHSPRRDRLTFGRGGSAHPNFRYRNCRPLEKSGSGLGEGLRFDAANALRDYDEPAISQACGGILQGKAEKLRADS